MAKTNLQIKAKNAMTDQSITTTLTYVNPEADSTALKTFATKLNGLTTNIYEEANRVQSINVDTEEVTTSIPGSISLIDNPQIIKQQPDIIKIPLNSLVINNQTLTELPSTTRIFGKAYNAQTGQLVIQTENTNTNIFIDTRTPQGQVPTGAYQLMLAIDPLDQYTAATTRATITVS